MRYVILLTGFAAACGGSDSSAPEVRGTYTVVSHTRAQAPSSADLVSCETEGPAATDVPFFRLIDDEFFGHGVALETCTSADESTCVDASVSFLDERSDGWEWDTFSTQSGGGTDCNLYHSNNRVVLNADGTVTVTLKEWFATSTADNCDLDDAEALGDDPDCMLHEVMVGELVP